MKRLVIVLALISLAVLGVTVAVAAAAGAAGSALPAAASAPAAMGPGDQPIIIDHHCTDIDKIPDEWLDAAEQWVIHYAHTSHGEQVLQGLYWLETEYPPTYTVAIRESGIVTLPEETGVPRIYDGNNYDGNTYITPDLYWESEDGIAHTESVADTGWFNLSTWTWCGQAGYYSEEQIQQYLDTMTQLEAQYPAMRFFLMTGHTDGTGSGDTLWRNNGMIRQHALDNAMVLFDFSDIETYDPLGGGPHLNDGEGTCTWCQDFCDNHPEHCTSLPSGCSHSSGNSAELFCKLKGQAFWWMMARLAGWDGVPGSHRGSGQSGDWSAAGTWGDSTLPAAGDAVTITAGTTVTVDAAATCYRLTIEPGAALIIPAGIPFTVTHNIDNQGTIRQTQLVDNASVAFPQIGQAYGITLYRGVEIETSNDLGLVTVAIRVPGPGESCTAGSSATLQARRCFEIEASQDATATLRMWTSEDELGGIVTPRIFRYVGSSWVELSDNAGSDSQGLYTYAQGDTPGFSSFLIAESGSNPTQVGVYELEARGAQWTLLALAALGLVVGAGMAFALRKKMI